MPKKVLIAIPAAMLELADKIAMCEHRTRSDLIRQALREYSDRFKLKHQHLTEALLPSMEIKSVCLPRELAGSVVD